MGYRIVYRPAKKNRRGDGNALRRVVLTGAAFALFVQLVERFWGEGSAVLERLCSLENRAGIACFDAIRKPSNYFEKR